jgi:effector-binding domain-containing protein
MHEMPRITGFAAKRRRTKMPCLRLVAPFVLSLTVAFAVPPALAQHAPGGLSAPSPLQPGDAFGEGVTLPERTIVYLKGTSKWDGAFDTLIDAFKSLHDYLDKAGIKPAGPAMTIYTQTDDAGFSFEAAVPIATVPANPPKGDIAIGKAPSGKALKFVHRGSYDAMDSTYEAITNYLDDKHLDAQDLFIEEYTTDPVKTDADQLVINVFIPIK